MAREVSSPQLKLLPHPTCSSSTTHLLHTTAAAPRDGTGHPWAVSPRFPAEPPSETLAPPGPSPPQPPPPPLTRSHAPAALPGHRPCEAVGRPGRGAGRAGLSRSKAHFARWGKALGWPGAVSKTPAAAAGRSPPPAACTAAEAGPQASPLTAAPALRPPRPAPGVLELVPPRPWAG